MCEFEDMDYCEECTRKTWHCFSKSRLKKCCMECGRFEEEFELP